MLAKSAHLPLHSTNNSMSVPSFQSPFAPFGAPATSTSIPSATAATTTAPSTLPSFASPFGVAPITATRTNTTTHTTATSPTNQLLPNTAFTSPFAALSNNASPTPSGVSSSPLNNVSSTTTTTNVFPPFVPPPVVATKSGFPPPSFVAPPPTSSNTSQLSTTGSLPLPSSLAFPAPSFASTNTSSTASTPQNFPLHFPSSSSAAAAQSSSHLNSAPASTLTSVMHSHAASRFPSAPVSAGGSLGSSRLGSGPSSGTGSPRFSSSPQPPSFMRGDLASPLSAGSATSVSSQPSSKGSIGLFASPAASTASLAPFAFPGSTPQVTGHHSLNGSPPHSTNSSHVASPMMSPRKNTGGSGSGMATPSSGGGKLLPNTAANANTLPVDMKSSLLFPKSQISAIGIHIHPPNASTSLNSVPVSRPTFSRAPSLVESSDPATLPAHIPPFPASLRATECSSFANILINGDAAPPPKPAEFFTPIPMTPAQPATAAKDDALKLLMSTINFSLTSLVLDAASHAPIRPASAASVVAPSPSAAFVESIFAGTSISAELKPFSFAEPSPDDVERARIQAVGSLSRGAVTDSSSNIAKKEEQVAKSTRKKFANKGTGGKLRKDVEEDEEDEEFLHSTDRRAAMGGMLSLSTGSVGAPSSSGPLAQLAAASKGVLTSRPFQALYRSIVGLKRVLLEDVYRGCSIAALIDSHVVREPRKREAMKNDDAASAAVNAAADAAAFAVAEEPWQAKGTSTAVIVSSFTPSAMPTQVAGAHTSLQQSKASNVRSALQLASSILPSTLKTLYERKRAIYDSERLALPVHTQSLSEQAFELVTPTPNQSYLSSLATLNMLVIGSAQAGISTLLGNFLYQLGRLPFSLVKPRGLPPNYWESFNGQQSSPLAISSVVSSNPHSKLNQWNSKYDYAKYTHCFYTNRYKVNVLHQNMGGILLPQPANTSSSSSSSSSKSVAPTAQQMNLSILSALQCDFIMLVLDASSGASFQPTILMQQQCMIAHMCGVRNVVLCLTKLDSGNAAWSEKKVTSLVASVISSFLKPLGFVASNIVSIPVSGMTGENLIQQKSKELSSWYDGPTLHSAIDRITLPVHRQVESIADRKLCLQVLEAPKSVASILNDSTLDSVRVRVQVVSGLLLNSEPVALLSTTRGTIGPVGMRTLEREERVDSRDLQLYLDDEDSSESSSSSASASSSAAPAKTKYDASGKKLTNAERKQAQATAKKEFARQDAKAKQALKNQNAAWKQEEWNEETTTEESVEGGDDDASSSSVAASAVSSSSSSATSNAGITTTLVPAPMLTPGDIGVLSLCTLHPPASNADDELTTLLTGRNAAENVQTHSTEVLAHIAKSVVPGDILTLPVPDGNESLRTVTHFKAEIFGLTSWSSELHLKNGQGITFVPLRGTLPSPASISHSSSASLWSIINSPSSSTHRSSSSSSSSSMLGSSVIVMDRIVNILNKASRTVIRKKPESVCGPAADSLGDLFSVEFSSSRPILLDTFNLGGPKMSNFLVVHSQEIIGVACVTQITN